MLETIVSVSIHKREPAIVGKTDLCRVCSFFGSADGRVNYAVIKHIRQRTTDGRAEGFYIIFSQVRRFSAVGNLVVMQIHLLGERTITHILDLAQFRVVLDHVDVGGVVIVDLVLKDLHVVDGHDVHARSGRQVINVSYALGCKVGDVVVVNLVAEDAHVLASLLGQAGQIEDTQSAGIVDGNVVVDIHVLGVFHFVSIHVVLSAIAAHDHVLRLSNVEAGIDSPFSNGILDQHVFAFRRIDRIRAIPRIGSAGPLYPHAPDSDVVASLYGQAVSGSVLDGQVFNDEVVGLDQHSRSALFLSGERQDAFIHALAANRYLVGGKRKCAVEMKLAFRNLDYVTRLGLDQLFL